VQALLVHKPGPFTLVQDAGRPGWRRFGIPPSGALDQFAFRPANLLAGNAEDAAVLEITLPGLVLEALAPLVVAVTGADLDARLNGTATPGWTGFSLRRGDVLAFRQRRQGCRAYLAVAGGLDTAVWLGSRSTFAAGKMGSPLRAGGVLESFPPGPDARPGRRLPLSCLPDSPAVHRIRVTLGPQDGWFTRRGLETFLGSVYRLSPQSSRQGFRTEGPAIEAARQADLISDPTPLGAVQVPGDGKPIVLHRDGQSTGGYPKVARLISADLDWFARMMPGDALRFEAVSRQEAVRLAAHAAEKWRAIVRDLAQRPPLS